MTRSERLAAIAENVRVAGAKSCNVPEQQPSTSDEIYAKLVIERVTAWTRARDRLSADAEYLLADIACLEAALRAAKREHDSGCQRNNCRAAYSAHWNCPQSRCIQACTCGADAHNVRIDRALEGD